MCSNDELRNEILSMGAKVDALMEEVRTNVVPRLDQLEQNAVMRDGLPEALKAAGVITNETFGDVFWDTALNSTMKAAKFVVTVGGAAGVVGGFVAWVLRAAFGG